MKKPVMIYYCFPGFDCLLLILKDMYIDFDDGYDKM
jgi:hypothetical protein